MPLFLLSIPKNFERVFTNCAKVLNVIGCRTRSDAIVIENASFKGFIGHNLAPFSGRLSFIYITIIAYHLLFAYFLEQNPIFESVVPRPRSKCFAYLLLVDPLDTAFLLKRLPHSEHWSPLYKLLKAAEYFCLSRSASKLVKSGTFMSSSLLSDLPRLPSKL
ncbi:hypothetical protein BpHYR1_047509 [Brachionus plicatilis]|uniref:Uncharacterized protein n=1 Tax=Brachionus plicatilis TaxID=10195 RepID=A0A3M7PNN3_BRAPC|nr:hypothetical protein BpHYR1_047509 [Brachionus plicatilis]